MYIVLPVVALGGMGLLFGVLLAVASKIFAVKEDERIPLVTEALPGANCGGCGYAGCSAYANAVVNDGAPVSACPVGGAAVAAKIAAIMGVEADTGEKRVARVLCMGNTERAAQKYEYDGPADCHTANRLGAGPKMCSYGCIGLGSCVKVCKFNAITVENGVAKVDMDKCTACGACVKECPKGIIKILPQSSSYTVLCHSKDKGKMVTKACGAGCIGCGICAKNCPSGAITIENNIAVIDEEKCVKCGVCAEKCPRKCIKHIIPVAKAFAIAKKAE